MLKTMKNEKLRIKNGKILKFFILHSTFIIIPQGVNSADKKTI
jgi:hypothetical protein